MVTISPHWGSTAHTQYKVFFSNPGTGTRGFSVMADNLAEVHTAIDHYHAENHNTAHCPLCRKNGTVSAEDACLQLLQETGG